MADAQTQTQKQEMRGPARIKLSTVHFHDSEDFPGGNTLQYSLDCTGPKVQGRQFFVGWFIPAWQIVEIEYHANDKAPPRVFRYPVARIKRFE